jgi:hypothetical protein
MIMRTPHQGSLARDQSHTPRAPPDAAGRAAPVGASSQARTCIVDPYVVLYVAVGHALDAVPHAGQVGQIQPLVLDGGARHLFPAARPNAYTVICPSSRQERLRW